MLEEAIGIGPIEWQSPLLNDERAEYRDADALERVGLSPRTRPLADFWPVRGPQWDALGRARTGDAVLVEAKAHISELFSSPTDASGRSLERIQASLQETAKALGAKPGLDWSLRFYQYANRLAHAYFLNVLNAVPARLVFVHFIGDADMRGPVSRAEWIAAISVLHEALGVRGQLPRYVTDIFIDIRPSAPVVA